MVANNPLYKKIQINHRLLKIWEDKFIPSGIMDSIVYCNANQYKQEGYATDLNNDNIENNLDTAIASTSIKGDHIHSGCVYSDIDKLC